MFEWPDEVEKWRRKENNIGLYTSVFRYNNKDLDHTNRLGNLYFDIDNKDPKISLSDAQCLVNYLLKILPEEAIRIYFTGLKGFHVEVEAVALGVDPSNDLPDLYRYVATVLARDLEIDNFDFQVYDIRRIWRLPNSQHQQTGLFKVPLHVREINKRIDYIRWLAKEPLFDRTVPAQTLCIEANQWLKDLEATRMEQRRIEAEERIARFNRLGTENRLPPGIVARVIQRAIEDLKECTEGSRNHTLNKKAFQLYQLAIAGHCTEQYVTDLLTDIAETIGLGSTETEATLRSAYRAAERKPYTP
ncbi:MAG TPA: hypothetical protein VJ742_12000 [Nitrososphaera sp.]|nr:hypothetical protein [Nitrososphaera sp.]